jgi:hypothetical protein
MTINIDHLSERELRDLHSRITERLRVLAQLRAHGAMMQFSIGDRVSFNADGRIIRGVLIRYNRKSVTVLDDQAGRWNVSPGLLERVEPETGPVVVRSSVAPLLRLAGSDSGKRSER